MLPFKFISLTPIVTGDYEKGNNKLLATGLIGSLRYQYWLMKAMEDYVNGNKNTPPIIALRTEFTDTQYKKDPQNPENLKKVLKKAGPVIQLFGTTGWKRAFHLEVTESEQIAGPFPSSARPTPQRAPYLWSFTLHFRLREGAMWLKDLSKENSKEFIDPEEEIKKLVSFVHRWGWLGAAPQNGFGWVQICETAETSKFNSLEDNPVFFARLIKLTNEQFQRLNEKLIQYYVDKKDQKEKELQKVQMRMTEKVREKSEKLLKAKINRYQFSLDLLKSCKTCDFGFVPMGYELRQYLKFCLPSYSKYFGESGKNGYASYIHVTHPVISDSAWLFTLRFCNKPGERFLNIDSSKDLIDKCEEILRG